MNKIELISLVCCIIAAIMFVHPYYMLIFGGITFQTMITSYFWNWIFGIMFSSISLYLEIKHAPIVD